jgi:hypothetical protein
MTGRSNGATEGINLLIKKIKCVGFVTSRRFSVPGRPEYAEGG